MTWVIVLLGLAGICLIVLMVKRVNTKIEGFQSCGCVDECDCHYDEEEEEEEEEDYEEGDEEEGTAKKVSGTTQKGSTSTTGKGGASTTGKGVSSTGAEVPYVQKSNTTSNCVVPAPNVTVTPGPPLTFANYILHKNSDLINSDIACFNDGRDATTCKALCDADPNCQSFSSIKGIDGSNVGCCYKTKNEPIVPYTGQAIVNLYTKRLATVCDWITAANAGSWKKLSPYIIQASIGDDGTIAGVDGYFKVFQSSGITGSFNPMSGSLTQVDTKAGIVVGSESNGGTLWKYDTAGNWMQMQGTGRWISVGADKEMWYVGMDQSIYRMVSGSWQKTPGTAIQISVGDANNVWMCNGFAVFKWQGINWTNIPTPVQVKQVAVSAKGKHVVALGIDGSIYGWNNLTWIQISGNFNATLTINDSYVIATNNVQSGDYAGAYYKSLLSC